MLPPVPTTRCPRCGREYATECPACPYCNWVPLKPGRAKWHRTAFIAIGTLVSAGLAVAVRLVEHAIRLDTNVEIWVFALGVFFTIVRANRHVGGGQDV
jgi:hypothetical protein